MEMANCLRCRKVFTKFKEPICEECKKKDEELFVQVKTYLEENPVSTIHQISVDTGASTKKILSWLREGRLETAEATGELKCRQCGADVTTGQLCEPCIAELSRQIDGMMSEKPGKPDEASARKGIVMHTQNRK